jgi:cytochrome c oxidase cbb3-type subunit III
LRSEAMSSPVRQLFPLLCVAALLAGCEREQRELQTEKAPKEEQDQIVQSSVSPGQNTPQAFSTGRGAEFEKNAYHLSQGKKFFSWYNCTGCHAEGGGDIGPALIDERWVYGNAIENIAASIREGRPNGMPSFRGRIPEQQVWQLAAYVRSLGSLVPKDAPPGRNDDLQSAPGENRMQPDPLGPADNPPTAGPPRTEATPPPVK